MRFITASEQTRVCSAVLTPSRNDGPLLFANIPSNRTASSIPRDTMQQETPARFYECLPSVFKLHAKGSLLEHQHVALLGAILDCYGFAITP